jgi:hypothetical protein
MIARSRRLFAVAALTCGGQLAAQSPGRAVFTRADIQAAGWQRISEILDAAPGWRITSTDGFTITPSAEGLPNPGASGLGSPSVTIIVDGAKVPVSVLGQSELEFAPVLLAQLDSVVLTTEPRLVLSRIETHGTIEFFSRNTPRGTSAQGEFQVGDVANKPGLYKYTPLNPSNREHHGPFHHLLFGYGTSRGGLEVGYRFATLNTTDSLILARTPGGLTVGTAQINEVAPVIHGDLDVLGGHNAIDATRAHYSGLYFVPSLGHEQSLRMYATSVTASGVAPMPRHLQLDYSAAYTSDDLTPLPSASPSTTVHGRVNENAAIAVSKIFDDSLRATLGGAFDTWTLHLPVGASDLSRAAEHLSGQVTMPRLGRFASTLGATLTHSELATNPGGLLSMRFDATHSDALTFFASALGQAVDADGSWIDPLIVRGSALVNTRSSLSADASWMHALLNGVTLFTGARASSVANWPIALAVDTGFAETRGEVPRAPLPQSINTAAWRFGVEAPHASRFSGRVMYSFSAAFGGDSLARDAARSVARHQVNGVAWFAPGGNWRFMTLVQAVSATHWSAFPAINGGWPPDVGGFTRIDLGAEKWLMHRRFRLQYLVRDIFNDSERWQPRAAQFNLRWMLSGSFVAGFRD